MTTDIAKKIKRDGDIRLRRDIEKLDEPIRAERWRNLAFSKSGRSMLGFHTFDTPDGAKNALDNAVTSPMTIALQGIDGYMYISDYSHAIQMPVKE